jgi:hypothetical protein
LIYAAFEAAQDGIASFCFIFFPLDLDLDLDGQKHRQPGWAGRINRSAFTHPEQQQLPVSHPSPGQPAAAASDAGGLGERPSRPELGDGD